MKILHILDHSLPLHSGYTFRSQNIFRAQQRRGWRPVVVTSPKHEESWKGASSDVEIIEDVTYYRTGKVNASGFPIVSEWELMRALGLRLMEVAKTEKPDLLHAHSPVLDGIPAIYAGRKLGLPVVYEIRAFWEDAAVDHGTYRENSWKYRLTRSVETLVCRGVSHVTTLCNGIRNDLHRRGIPLEKMTCVFNGVNPDDFSPCAPDEILAEQWGLTGKTVIGFIGSFYRYEGLDLLVEAFARVSSGHPDLRLLLVGGGEMEKELMSRIHALGLTEKAVMPGRIPHDRVPGVYAMIDILAYPRYAMRLTDLVTPLKPLEAMAMGKVLLASDVGGHRELIRHQSNGVLFRAGDTEDLAKALDILLGDETMRRRIQLQAMEWVRANHTWEKTTSVYQEIYTRAIRKKTRRMING